MDYFIKSYCDYDHKFSIPGGDVIVFSKWNKPNVTKVTEAQYEALQKCAEFVAMIDGKSNNFRMVKEMPRDQLDVMANLAQARDETEAARNEAEQSRKEAEEAKREVEKLKREIEENGGGTSESESIRLAKEETERYKQETEAALAELAELKAKKKPEAEPVAAEPDVKAE